MSIKILLADDSITIQKVVGIIFGSDEYSLTVVDNGKAAIEKAREICPDVLLIDALMPGMTGYEVSEEIRAIPELATKPILLLTGTFEQFDESKAKSCGANDFIAKPFESQQIVTKVKELYDLGDSGSSAPAVTFQEPAAPVAAAAPPVQEAAGDIWGAFTDSEEPAAAAPSVAFEEQSPFAAADEPEASNKTTGSQWVPVEEETFEFQEPAAPATAAVVEDITFGDIAFAAPEEPASIEIPAAAPAVEQPEPEQETFFAPEPEVEPAPVQAAPVVAPVVETTDTAACVTEGQAAAMLNSMSEEQLANALRGITKEVVERIVWEVVPDLAEAMIKEAIRKIKEGA